MMLRKGVYHWEKWKINWTFQHLFKPNHSRPSIVPITVSLHVPVAFVVGRLVLHWRHTHVIMCNYGGIGQQIKSANYLHLEMVQALATCKWCPRKNEKKLLSNYWVSNKIKYCLKYISSIVEVLICIS